MLRWQLLDEHPRAGAEPGITVRRVPFAALPSALPEGVARIDEEGRRAQLAARGAAYARRFVDR